GAARNFSDQRVGSYSKDASGDTDLKPRPRLLCTRRRAALLRSRPLLLLILLMAPVASAQRQFTLSVDTQLVVETVTVRDKDGKTIEGLRADDFVVTEDGAPQTISIFQFERSQDAAPSNPSEAPKPVQVLKANQITP